MTPSDPRAMLDRLERECPHHVYGADQIMPLIALSRDALRYRELAEEAVDLLEGYAVAYVGQQATAAAECVAKIRAVLAGEGEG